ncbi:MAG TPA: UvrD-helicase domain-containing protein [Candidatus Saccharibacteria bacterium]|nr:UvrD-helicase domain-containing protein [Candidatus Saccharibacteria bacterium]HMT39526.1 UvrD-helicase domain-containing protein [Candidatus Saccharibacteria bacterium]
MKEIILNSAQKKAVTHTVGPMMVVAGAGTGKTAIITLRIANLIQNHSIKGESILALTFTDKASDEMEDRVYQLLPYGYTDVSIHTFHALGDMILREYGNEIGISSDFIVMTKFQQVIMMQNIVNSSELIYHRPLGDPYSFVDDLIKFVSRLKDENVSPKDFAEFVSNHKPEDKQEALRQKELSIIYQLYSDTCLKQQMLDFGDQIVLCIKLLESRPEIKKILKRKYQFIMVDEYQDTNYAQSYLLKLLVNKQQNIMVVGDDDQSIYRFRGAAVSNILKFMEEYPNAKQIVIRKNYRSSQKVLDQAYRLIQNNNPYRLEIRNKLNKKLIGSKGYSEVGIVGAQDILTEMDTITDKIEVLIESQNIDYRDIAVLIRKNNQSKSVANSLLRSKIPYVISESQNLFEQSEIRLILNFIHVINNPNASNSLYGLLVSDMFKCNLNHIAHLSGQARQANLSLERFLIETNEEIPVECNKLLEMIKKYREISKDQNAGSLIYQFIKETGYLQSLIEDSHKNASAAQKIANITQLFVIIGEFEQVNRFDPHIYALWQHLSAIEDSGAEITVQPSPLDINAVRIMTIHKAKGLEFEAVFIPDMTEQNFPSRKRTDRIRMPEGLIENKKDESIEWNIHEERRLLYVAITRAKKYLYLTYSYDHGKKRLKKPSRFLQELKGTILDKPSIDKVNNISTIQSFSSLPKERIDPLRRFISEDGWLHISTNQLANYLRSPKEFWYFDVLNLPKGPFHTLVYGSAIHSALEFFYNSMLSNSSIGIEDVLQLYENSWKNEGFVSLEHEHDRYKQGQQVLRDLYKREIIVKRFPEYVEKPFRLTIDSMKIKISGRYDAIYNDNSKIEIRDFKTGSVTEVASANKRLRDSLQMKIYALSWTINETLPLDSISLYFVESDILAKTSKIDNDKTIEILKLIATNIRKRKFDDVGQSRLNFEALI